MQLEVGNILEGKVTGITNFGAFVQLDESTTGLVHISEVATSYVKDIKDHLKEHDVVKVKVMSIDKGGKISLSIKKAIEEEQGIKPREFVRKSRPNNNSRSTASVPPQELSFEDKLNRFKQDSDEKMQALKRSGDSKRGGGYKRSTYSF